MVSGRSRIFEDFHLYKQYVKEIKKYPLLTREEERSLFMRLSKGDKRASKKLVCSNLRFVVKIALLYRGQGLSITELINEGNVGLIESIRRYDLIKKVRFTSYAVWWIRHAIVQAVFEKARLVRISAQKELMLRRIRKYSPESKYVSNGGHSIDAYALGKKMGMTEKQMQKTIEMGQHHSSLSSPYNDDSNDVLMDKIQDNSVEYPDDSVMKKSVSAYLEENLNSLKPLEKKVIVYFFGLNANKFMNLREIAEVIGLSKERVRQLKESALDKLRGLKFDRDFLLAA
jgi:RNA polymerase primary sigma factor